MGGVIIDGPGTLYTKAIARNLVLAASLAGCTFPGRSLVEAIGNLQNFQVQAKNAGSGDFTIPFDRQSLADYLGVERSAMSAEISKLRKDGILETTGSSFRLLSKSL